MPTDNGFCLGMTALIVLLLLFQLWSPSTDVGKAINTAEKQQRVVETMRQAASAPASSALPRAERSGDDAVGWLRPRPAVASRDQRGANLSVRIVALVPTLEMHPSCTVALSAAEDFKASGVRPVHKDFICFKHGGHFPGCWRGGAPATKEALSAADRVDAALQQLEFEIGSSFDANRRLGVVQKLAKIKKNAARESSIVTQLVVEDAVVYRGQIYSAAVPPVPGTRSVHVSGIYSMISNNWPQTLTRTVRIHSLAQLPDRVRQKVLSQPPATTTADSEKQQWDFGYWQPPTDFVSSYHVMVEVTLTMFHAVLRAAASMRRVGKQRQSVSLVALWNDVIVPYYRRHDNASSFLGLPCSNTAAVIASRPKHAMWGFKKQSCHFGGDVCLSTVWATMYTTLFAFVAPAVSFASPSAACAAPHVPVMRTTGAQRAAFAVLGLSSEEEEPARLFRRLHVGYPTHCEPLWGRDPVLLNVSRASWDDAQTRPALQECDLLLWAFRSVLIRAALESAGAARSPPSSPSFTRNGIDAPIGARAWPPRIVFASRRGDWARDVTNELDFLLALDRFIDQRNSSSSSSSSSSSPRCGEAQRVAASTAYAAARQERGGRGNKTRAGVNASASGPDVISFCHVHSVRFAGSLERQIELVAASDGSAPSSVAAAGPTIFIAPHGANILPSVFLPPNAGVITLDSDPNGFFPFGTVPSWLHWRRLAVKRVCNFRLEANARGKCKVASFNNDDLEITPQQQQRIFALVEDIVASQSSKETRRAAPFRSLFDR